LKGTRLVDQLKELGAQASLVLAEAGLRPFNDRPEVGVSPVPADAAKPLVV
jgi:hypothetical protein